MLPALHAVLEPSILVAAAYLSVLGVGVLVAALRAGGRRDDEPEQHDTLAASRFTIPVSLVIPAGSDPIGASRAIRDALTLNYPELEVIAVLEDLTPAGLQQLSRDWRLEAKEVFYRQVLEPAPVRRIYRSSREPNVVVVDAPRCGRAAALNAGVNLARFRYVACVDPALAFDADALLRIMAAPLRDPAAVVGASHHVERTGVPGRLASVRAFMASRLWWRHLDHGFGPADLVAVWRRDAVLAVGGFSPSAIDPNLDLALRLQTSADLGALHFHRGADVFGRRLAPGGSHAQRAPRRHRAIMQMLGACGPAEFDALGPRTVAGVLATDLLTPLATSWVFCGTVLGAALGWFGWLAVVAVGAALAFGYAAVTTAALLMRGAAPAAPDSRELRRLALRAPLEFVLLRPLTALAGVLYR